MISHSRILNIGLLCLTSVLLLLLIRPGVKETTTGDPEVRMLLDEARRFPREQFGFSPLPSGTGTGVILERNMFNSPYSIMLKFGGKTTRSIAFVRSDGGYKWVHEQEFFKEPQAPWGPDGSSEGGIRLIYETRRISAVAPNQLNITYVGNNPQLKEKRRIELSDVRSLLAEWREGLREPAKPGAVRNGMGEFLGSW